MNIRVLSAIAVLILQSTAAIAHDMWMQPETFFPAPHRKTVVHLYVGDRSKKEHEERPFQLAKTPQFRLYAGERGWDLRSTQKDNAFPLHELTVDKPGLYLLAMERNWSYIKLEPRRFEDYLRMEGMEYIVADRAKLGESAKEGSERYSRFVKTLLSAGNKQDDTWKRAVGLKLELVPLDNPYEKKVGDKLAFQVLFDGKPLAGKTVFADNQESGVQKLTSDSQGKITMLIDKNGLWLMRMVFMQRCTSDCGASDWESFWSTLAFGVK